MHADILVQARLPPEPRKVDTHERIMNSPDTHHYANPALPVPQPVDAARLVKAQRWRIRAEQEHLGHEPCFRAERRLFCRETRCPWRAECLSLHAEWRR